MGLAFVFYVAQRQCRSWGAEDAKARGPVAFATKRMIFGCVFPEVLQAEIRHGKAETAVPLRTGNLAAPP